MDSEQATFSCGFRSGCRHPDYIKISCELELQDTSGTSLVQGKGNSYITAMSTIPRWGMEYEFRQVGRSRKKKGPIINLIT